MTLKKPSLPSNRSFGFLFSAISAGFGIYRYIKGLDQYIWFGWVSKCIEKIVNNGS